MTAPGRCKCGCKKSDGRYWKRSSMGAVHGQEGKEGASSSADKPNLTMPVGHYTGGKGGKLIIIIGDQKY